MTGTSSIVYPRAGFIGFDHIFDQLESIHKHAKDHYPPYNVVKDEDLKFIIELAVAGFKKEHIDIEVKDHVLTITGNRPLRRDQENMFIRVSVRRTGLSHLDSLNTQKSPERILWTGF